MAYKSLLLAYHPQDIDHLMAEICKQVDTPDFRSVVASKRHCVLSAFVDEQWERVTDLDDDITNLSVFGTRKWLRNKIYGALNNYSKTRDVLFTTRHELHSCWTSMLYPVMRLRLFSDAHAEYKTTYLEANGTLVGVRELEHAFIDLIQIVSDVDGEVEGLGEERGDIMSDEDEDDLMDRRMWGLKLSYAIDHGLLKDILRLKMA